MKSGFIKMFLLGLLFATSFGCGGGGGGGSSVGGGSTTPVVTTMSGVASNAPIAGGTVKAYKIVAGVKGDLIATTTTAAGGAYTLDLGTYTGPVLVEVTGGAYIDEATGSVATVPEGAPLHVAVPTATGSVTASVTPLTELAYQMSKSYLSAANIGSANSQVATLFKLSDIVSVRPVDPTAASLASASKEQRDYTVTLATVSQVGATAQKSVADTVALLKSGIASSGSSFDQATITAIQTAAQTIFQGDNPNNTTGITDPGATNIVTIGAKKATVKFSVVGTGSLVGGVRARISLPAGVTVKTDSTGAIDSSVLLPSGNAASGSFLAGSFNNGAVIIGLTSKGGFAVGEFATLTCDVPYNVQPVASEFKVLADDNNYPLQILDINVKPLLFNLKLDVTIK